MVKVKDRRTDKRVNAYWVVTLKNNISGFLINLSHGGLKLWLDKNIDISNQVFPVQIRLSYVFPESTTLYLKPLWINSTHEKDYNEVGCQFQNYSSEQQENINKLIKFFDTINVKEYMDAN